MTFEELKDLCIGEYQIILNDEDWDWCVTNGVGGLATPEQVKYLMDNGYFKFGATIVNKESRVKQQEQGRKNDIGKLRMELIPVTALKAMARGLGYGAGIYGDRNWERGLATSRLYAALLRHLTAWWEREETDPESGLSHLDHVLCCAAMLEGTVTGKLGEDDRPLRAKIGVNHDPHCGCSCCLMNELSL